MVEIAVLEKRVEGIRQKVHTACERAFGQEVKDDTDFATDLHIDSLDWIELAMHLEIAFGIEIDDDVAQVLPIGVVGELVLWMALILACRE